MTKEIRNTIIIIAIILLVFAIIVVIYQNLKTEPIDANTTPENILDDPNAGLENMLNEIFNEENNNVVENTEKTNTEVEKNTTNNSSANSSTTQKQEQEEELTEDDNTMTPKETKAINLVKEKWKDDWGSLKDVSFNVSIQSDGKYGVTVYDTTTTQSIQFYIVDVNTGIIKER